MLLPVWHKNTVETHRLFSGLGKLQMSMGKFLTSPYCYGIKLKLDAQPWFYVTKASTQSFNLLEPSLEHWLIRAAQQISNAYIRSPFVLNDASKL